MKDDLATESHWTVYIVRCADRTLYTGIAKSLSERINKHNSGKGAKYTRSRLPVTVVYAESVDDHGSALRREREIKRMPTATKRDLVASYKQSLAFDTD